MSATPSISVTRGPDHTYEFISGVKLLECDVTGLKNRVEFADCIPDLPPGDGLLAMVFMIAEDPWWSSDNPELTLFFPIPDRSRSRGTLDRILVARFIPWGEMEKVWVRTHGAVKYRIADGGHRVEISLSRPFAVDFRRGSPARVAGATVIEDPYSSQRLHRLVCDHWGDGLLPSSVGKPTLVGMARNQDIHESFRNTALNAIGEHGDRETVLAVGRDLPDLTGFAYEALADCLMEAYSRLRDPAIGEILLREIELRTGRTLEDLRGLVYDTPLHIQAIERLLRSRDPDRITLGAAWILRLEPISEEQKKRLAAVLPDWDDHEDTPGLANVLLLAYQKLQ
jgi:hypothetical protein